MKKLSAMLLIILVAICCQKSPDQNLAQMRELVNQQKDRLAHIPSIQPVKEGKIISRFGQQVDSLTNSGVDIAVESDAQVFATATGKIIEVEKSTSNGKNLVVIDHGFGLQTRYSNLSEIFVAANQAVKRWSLVGRIKKSADQPALLHYEVIKNGKPVDPEQYFLSQ